MDFGGSHRMPGKLHQEIGGGRENDNYEYQTGDVPFEGSPFVCPEESAVKESSNHFFFFLMISETSLKAAGRIVSKKSSKMYLPGSSLPR